MHGVAPENRVLNNAQCLKEKWPGYPQPTADPDQLQPRPFSEKAWLARSTARIQANKLTSRLQDQQDRKDIYALLDLSHKVTECDDFETAQAKLLEMEYKLSDANERILGPILRNIYGL